MKFQILKQGTAYLRATPVGRLFLDKKFFNYTWIAIFISLLNIFLLWLLIDIFDISTLISSTLVIGATFIIRYILFGFFKIV